MKTNRRNKTFRIVLLGMLTAIIIIQTTVPFLGYIPVGPLSLTIIPVTVIIAAIVLGPVDGAIVGGVWGVITFIRAFTSPTSPIAMYVFINPVVSVVPRIFIGLVAAYAFHQLIKTRLPQVATMSIAAILGSLTNTLLVLGFIYVFYRGTYANFSHIDVSAVLPALLGIVGTNGITEAIIAAIIVPIIAKPLLKLYKK